MFEETNESRNKLDTITYKIIGLAIEVHKQLGPGLLESAYKECLFYEIVNSGLIVEKEKILPIVYKDIKLDHGYKSPYWLRIQL